MHTVGGGREGEDWEESSVHIERAPAGKKNTNVYAAAAHDGERRRAEKELRAASKSGVFWAVSSKASSKQQGQAASSELLQAASKQLASS